MAMGAANAARRDLARVLTASPARRAALAAAVVISTVSAAVVGLEASRVLLRWLRAVRDVARFAYRLVTLGAFRRCSECRRVIRFDAKVCSHCGYR